MNSGKDVKIQWIVSRFSFPILKPDSEVCINCGTETSGGGWSGSCKVSLNDHISLGMFWWGVFFCKVTREIYYPYQSRLVAGQVVNLTMLILVLPKKEFLILWSSEFLTFAVTWPLIKRNAIMWSIPLPCVQCSLQ